MAVSFIGGGNRSTRRKPSTCRKSLTNFITKWCIEYTSPWTGIELATLVLIGNDSIDSCKSNYHTITTTTAPNFMHSSVVSVWRNKNVDIKFSQHDTSPKYVALKVKRLESQMKITCQIICSSCLIYVQCVCLRIEVSSTYCVVCLFCFSSSCVHYGASFSALCIFDCPFGYSLTFA